MTLKANARRSLQRFAGAWGEFWFAPEDPSSLGVLRMLVGAMLAYTHFVWGLNLDGFFGPYGWQSAEAVRGYFVDDWLPSLWWYVPPELLRVVHLLALVPILLFMLGVLTPVTSVLALVITISNSNRAPLANYGLDQILSLLTLYLVIGGSGAACSIDAWRRRRRIELDPPDAADPEKPYSRPRTARARLGTRLIQVHFCIIYFFAGTAKLQGESWWNGEAIWRAFANQEYQSIDMTWLAHYPWLLQLTTHVTNFWEISFAFLVWNRTLRPFVLAIGVLMHAGIGLCMGMITFGCIMIFGYMAFVPPELTQKVVNLFRMLALREETARDTATRSLHPFFVEPVADAGDSQVADAGLTTRAPPAAAFDVPHQNGRVSPTDAVAAEKRDTVSAADDHAEPPEQPAAPESSGKISIAICDPDWKYRTFAHYLTRRDYLAYVGTSPVRIWRFVETHRCAGVVIFADRLTADEFDLVLKDLTLSPISELPVILAARNKSRIEQSRPLMSANLRVLTLPQTYREIRQALESALASSEASPDAPAGDERTDVAPPSEALEADESRLSHIPYSGPSK